MEALTPEETVVQADADPTKFNDLLKTVWNTFENQIREDVEAVTLLKSAAAFISKNETFKKIEDEFKLGPLDEYVVSNEEALPFLATVMSHLHHALEDDVTVPQKEVNPKKTHTMTRFWEELEDRMGASDATKAIVEEISEKVSQVAENIAVENPHFALSLSEIGVCLKQSWGLLKKEVDMCIRHVRKKKYSKKSMEKIYSRLICKGINTARAVQQKIESVIIQHTT